MHSVVYVKWNDACEADDMQDAEMDNCIQEAAGFFVKRMFIIKLLLNFCSDVPVYTF